MSAAVGSSGRRSLRDLRFLWAVGVVTLLGVVAALVFQDRQSIDHDQLEDAAAELATLQVHDADGMLLFYQWMAQADLTSPEATQIGTGSLAAQTEAAATWRRFVARSADLPGEAELREQYQDMVTRASEWGDEIMADGEIARLAADPGGRAALISTSMPYAQQRVEVLSDLRDLYAEEIAAATGDLGASIDAVRTDVTIAVVCGLGTLFLAFFFLERSGRRRAHVLEQVETLLEIEGDRARLEGQLNRALELCNEESAAYRILEAGLDQVLTEGGAELLVADSSLAHLSQVGRVGDAVSCEVTTPADCPAVRRGHTQTFPSPTDIDACPHVRHRGGDNLTSCVPFTVAGNSVGVLHVASARPLTGSTTTDVELIARKTGERVGVARAFAKSQDQARTDPLTGLLNRRSLEERAREIVESGRQYALVFADLDHFKTLNDVHGHDAGDRALRLFSRCLREAVRPADAAARYGGEEFVLVLPDCDADGAAPVIARLRETMDQHLSAGAVPRFTASFGITAATGGPLTDVIARADAALLAAKRAGRNRSVVWGPEFGAGRSDDPVDAGADEADHDRAVTAITAAAVADVS